MKIDPDCERDCFRNFQYCWIGSIYFKEFAAEANGLREIAWQIENGRRN